MSGRVRRKRGWAIIAGSMLSSEVRTTLPRGGGVVAADDAALEVDDDDVHRPP